MEQLEIGTYKKLYALFMEEPWGSSMRDLNTISKFNTMTGMPLHRDLRQAVYLVMWKERYIVSL